MLALFPQGKKVGAAYYALHNCELCVMPEVLCEFETDLADMVRRLKLQVNPTTIVSCTQISDAFLLVLKESLGWANIIAVVPDAAQTAAA